MPKQNSKSQSAGKVFEKEFRDSCPTRLLLIRIPDPPQSFTQSNALRFAPKNPCDYIGYDTVTKKMFCFELKTTKSKSISVEVDDGKSAMVKRHQIDSLVDFGEYDGVIAGFVLNFRDEKNLVKRTYFIGIKDFENMMNNIDKKSFNEIDLLKYNAIKIDGKKKIKNYSWDIETFLDMFSD